MITTRLHQIAQGANDLDRAAEFYRDQLELPLIARFDPPGLVFFDLGNTRLLIEQGAASAILYLGVEGIEEQRRALEAKGVEFVDDVHVIHRDDAGTFGRAGDEEWMTFFRDSEDNLLALTERRAPAAGSG